MSIYKYSDESNIVSLFRCLQNTTKAVRKSFNGKYLSEAHLYEIVSFLLHHRN